MDNNQQSKATEPTGDQRDPMPSHTPGPWDYVPSTENHGPYVTSDFGSTICDCYVMGNPGRWGREMGETGKPQHFMHEMADPNARLIAVAPALLELARWVVDHFEGTDAKLGEWARELVAKATGSNTGLHDDRTDGEHGGSPS